MPDVTGPSVTLDGNPIAGAEIAVVNNDTGAVLGTTETDAAGNWSVTVDGGQTVHVLAKYEDSGGTLYQEHSKPFVVIESTGPTGTETHWWPIDEGSGTTLTDNAGSLDSQSWVGAAWRSGDGNGGHHLFFDGTDDTIGFGSFILPNTNGAFSAVMWTSFPDPTAARGCIFGSYNDFWFARLSDGAVVASYNNRSVDVEILPAAETTADTWYMIAATRDEAGNITTYRDNLGAQNTAVHDHANTSENHNLGSNVGNNEFNYGLADDLRLYDYELTAQDVLDIYNATSGNYTGH